MQRRYVTVDVFTDRLFGGNPLAVVLDAVGLSTAQMQAIAREFNYSETTFVLPPRDPAHDAEVRIFTPVVELPFAGHPNVGTAFVLAARAASTPTRLLFEERAGLVPVAIQSEAGRVVGAELTAPAPFKALSTISPEQVAACLSLQPTDIRTDRHLPQVISVGIPVLVAELTSREAVAKARPDATAFARTLPPNGSSELYFYTREVPASEAPCEVQARMFFPGASGLIEDPATGAATVDAAALFAALDPMADGELTTCFGQGFDMGRPSILRARVVKQSGQIKSVHVGGRCVTVMEGTFVLAGDDSR
jgi:trans-2,3-dihydro-3-hydroxyanthranilate isomerase